MLLDYILGFNVPIMRTCTCATNIVHVQFGLFNGKVRIITRESTTRGECCVRGSGGKAKVLSTQLFLVWCDFAVCHPIKREITS